MKVVDDEFEWRKEILLIKKKEDALMWKKLGLKQLEGDEEILGGKGNLTEMELRSLVWRENEEEAN